MDVNPIKKSLNGEHIVDVSPPMQPDANLGWQRRLNLYSGRALSDRALITEQQGRSGILATRGQLLSPGVITGLEVDLEQPDSTHYQIAAGTGVTAMGEDVLIPRTLRVAAQDLRVYAAAAILDGATPAPTPTPTGILTPRKLGKTLGELITNGIAATLPRVGILVLQPIVAELVGRNDPKDSCETDPQNDAFEDWQIVDGCRLVLYPWASEWLALPEAGDLTPPTALGRWRNRLAYTIFSAEKANTPDQLLPWEQVGVPIALVGFDAAWKPLFSDRYSVVRAGGLPKRRHPLVANAGSPFLWQARVQQFAEQLSELDLATVSISQVADQFLSLPPVGILPTSAIEVRSSNPSLGQNHFFPSSYQIQAAPVPLEQLDAVLESSASLVPFDVSKPDQVQVLVPVPQAWYEPDLLKTEAVDSEFQRTIDQMVIRRSQWLNRRTIVRSRNTLIAQAITGTAPDYADPDRLEDELAQPPTPFTSTRAHQSNLASGLHQHFFDGATAGLVVATGDRLTTYIYLDPDHPPREIMVQWNVGGSWEHRAYWGENLLNLGIAGTASRQFLGTLPAIASWVRLEVPASLVGLENTTVTGLSFTLYDGRAAWGHTGKSAIGALPANDTVWVGDTLPAGATPRTNNDAWTWIQDAELLTPFEEDFATAVANNVRGVTPLQTLNSQLAAQLPAEASQLTTLGLERFIALLDTKVKQANDRIDFHFLRVQTDIYRIRQFVLGTAQAARLATSPTLAAIAEGGQSARVTQEQLNTFFTRAKSTASVPVGATSPSFTILAAENVQFAAAPRKAALVEPLFTQTAFTNFSDVGFAKTSAFELKQTQNTQTRIGVINEQTADNTELFASKQVFQPSAVDVLEQSPLVGAASRTVTVAERLQASASVEARNFTLSSRADTIESLADLGVDLGEVSIPGTTSKFKDVNAALLKQIRLGDTLTSTDESAQFSDGVKVLDNTVAALRLAEGRVQDYRTAIVACQMVLTQLRGVVGQINQRLSAIANYLAEVRHDVAVARALLAEEQLRIDGINQRRDAILQQYVTFLVFHRLRFTQVILDAPTRPLDPGITSSPIPVCLNREIAVPAALRSLTETLRDAPVKWFTHIPRLIDRLDRFETIFATLQGAKQRAIRSYSADMVNVTSTATQLGQRIQQTVTTQRTSMAAARSQVAQLNLSLYSGLTWTQLRDQSTAVLSLGDLIDGGHGRSDVSQRAAQELDQIAHVAACLYANFGDVLPVIRLEWAERLSQYDAPVNLRNLASLPRWGEIALLDRREIQTIVDWLYQQIDALQPDAVALISDLVRVCILLASHAPVNQIIAGRLSKPTIVNLGSRVELAIDAATVRVGMQVLLYSALNRVVAQGVVEDLASGQASARIVHAYETNVQLAADSRVQFAEIGAFNKTLIARS